MAGDWIKMRLDLQSHPKIVRILSATKSDKFRVIGGLHAVWSVFDTHSENGELRGYTPESMDHVIGWDGFSSAMLNVGWLAFDGVETLTMPEFDEHNGKSAKRRAEDQKRKRDNRKQSELVPENCGQNSDKNWTREEKRREEEPLSGKPNDDCPHEEIIALYHEVLPELPHIAKWTDKRSRLLRTRWREDSKRQNLDYWRRLFEYIRKSDFLMGRTGTFQASLEWILTADKFVKILEGNYSNREEK